MNRARVVEVALIGLLLLAAGWMRLRQPARFIASDELRWTCRSINFHVALAEHDWGRTFQVGHPGVITMWLGALALPLEEVGRWRELCRTTDGGSDLSKLDDAGQEGLLQTIAPLLFAARRGVALGSLALLALVYLLLRLRVRIGFAPAAGGLALLAFDPFLLAHSRVLHLDAMVSLLAVSAVVALAAVAPERGSARWPAHALAGALAGMAMLAKASGLLVGPFAMAVYALSGWRARDWRAPLRGAVVWILAALFAYGLLWPAVWVQPVQAIQGVLTKAEEEGGSPHESGNFFLGQPVEDPGPLFYPVAAAFRLTPWALLGIAAAVALALRRRPMMPGSAEPDEVERVRRLVGFLLLWAAYFALVMTFGPKKFDRYLLPAILALDLAVGMALVTLVSPLAARALRRFGAGAASAAPAVALALAALQLAEAWRAEPYPLAYYNPLLGGASVAQHVLLVGWGEGYDLAAEALGKLPGAGDLEVTARGVANFAPLFAGRTRSAAGYRPGTADYVVLYISQVQRQRNEALVAAYTGRPGLEPTNVGRIAGIDYVWVYPNATLGALRKAIDERSAPGDVLVAGGETALARQYDGPLPLVRYWGHWGRPEMVESLGKDFPAGWHRAWVVRYPGVDPEVALEALGEVAERGSTIPIADGAVELTPFTRRAPP